MGMHGQASDCKSPPWGKTQSREPEPGWTVDKFQRPVQRAAAMRGHWRDCARHRFLLSRQPMWRWRPRPSTSRTTLLSSSTRSCCFLGCAPDADRNWNYAEKICCDYATKFARNYAELCSKSGILPRLFRIIQIYITIEIGTKI